MSLKPRPWRAVFVALLGYAYFGGAIVTLALLALLLIRRGYVAAAWLPGGLLLFMLNALMTQVPTLRGRELRPAEHPALWELIERVRARLDAPRPDSVVITDALNGAVLERPRFGLIGGSHRYLSLGLPLLQSLPLEEFEALLAHELAHLSRRHSRSMLWLLRASATWETVAFTLQQQGQWTARFFLPFFRWYSPRVEAVTLELSRAHELESDRLAAAAFGIPAAARALLRVTIQERRLARSGWPSVTRESAASPTPPADGIARLGESLARPIGWSEAAAAVRRSSSERTLPTHSHPALADRLRALGITPDAETLRPLLAAICASRAPSAAEALLGSRGASALAAELSQAWQATVADAWRQWHADAAADAGAAADAEALWARARWAAHCDAPETAIPLLRRTLAQLPDNPEVQVLLGLLLIESDLAAEQDEGARLLEAAARRDGTFALPAAEALQRHHARRGATRQVRGWHARHRELRGKLVEGLRERASLTARDVLRPLRLDGVAMTRLHEGLSRQPRVARAYLLEKRTRHLPDSPLPVLALMLDTPWYRPAFGKDSVEVCQALLPYLRTSELGDCSLVVAVEPLTLLHRRLRRLPQAEVYRRDGAPAAPPGRSPGWSEGGLAARVCSPAAVVGVCVLLPLLAVGIALLGELGAPRTPAQWEALLPRLEAAARENPDDPHAASDLASALVELQRWDEAAPALRAAMRLNPDDGDLHNSLGWWLMQQGEYEEAVALLERAVRLAPEHPLAHHNLGWSLSQLERFAEAEAAYRDALRHSPWTAGVRAELGHVLIALGRSPEAETELRQALLLEPSDARFQEWFALALIENGKSAEALAAYRGATRLDPANSLLLARFARYAHQSGAYEEAAAAFQRVHALDPSHFETHPEDLRSWEAARAGRPPAG